MVNYLLIRIFLYIQYKELDYSKKFIEAGVFQKFPSGLIYPELPD